MNRIYRSIWNRKTATFVAVSEHVKSGGQSSPGSNAVTGARFVLKTLTASLLLAFGSAAYALPTGGTVAAGSAGITGGNGSMTINQSSQNAVLNWNSFSIGQGESVTFVQPNSNSVALNRVLGSDPSSILGSLSANGKVFLVNPNGVMFGKGAQVNVGGLAASTLDISDSDFMAGRYRFSGTSDNSVRNEGTINADSGYVALLGANVSNQGTINARMGTVALAAGHGVTLDVAGDGLLNVTVDEGAVNALAQNSGLIRADGGQVLMTTQAAGTLLQTAVNNTGVIRAQTIENQGGVIKLLGDMQGGTVNVGGTLDAGAPNGGNGGFIETSAAHVKTGSDAHITTAAAHGMTGSWLIDPVDYTIAASGGDITGATLSANLGSTDVTILSTSGGSGTNGDVNVNDIVTWSANKLTLNAQNNININTAMNGSGTASLALQYGQGGLAAGNTNKINVNARVNLPAGNNFSTTLGSDGAPVNYTVITSLGAAGSTTGTDLQGIKGNLSGNYALGSDIDATATSGWNAGAGYTPMGTGEDMMTMDPGTPFSGTFDGLGHTISNLTINQPSTDNVGLFGSIGSSGVVKNIGLTGGSVTGSAYVGALAGLNYGTVANSYATGAVTGSGNRVGGLIGKMQGGTLIDSHASGTVSGAAVVGGLAGDSSSSSVSNSYATGTVTGSSYVGGLLGISAGGPITNSYANGSVTGSGANVGGLAGYIFASTITNTYATGAVSGNGNVGGLIGMRDEHGAGPSTITNSYWNTDVYVTGVGFDTAAGTTGLTSAEMQTASSFAGFNFTTTPGASGNNWVMVGIDGTLNGTGGTRPMLASEYSTTINNAHQLQLMSMDLGANYTLGQDIDAAATGTVNNVWSNGTFVPVGKDGANFTGTLNGLGHTISGLNITMPDSGLSGFSLTPTADEAGLFGHIGSSGSVQNVGLVGGSVAGRDFVGALAGKNDGTITNSYATGVVQGRSYVGGLIGSNTAGGTTSGSHATGAVTAGLGSAGGLIGYNEGALTGDYATGAVHAGDQAVGGFSAQAIGGLVGHSDGSIAYSYASGAVTAVNGSSYVGGLVGRGFSNSNVSNSYATGAVEGPNYVGGLLGINYGTVSNTYATGSVQGTSNTGGLSGSNYGSVTRSFWDTQTSGQASSNGGAGLTSTQMMQLSSFSSWNAGTPNTIAGTGGSGASWRIYEGHTAPLLTQFLTALTRSDTVVTTYDGTAQGASGSFPTGVLIVTETNAGTYDAFYSNQQGYDISGGTLTINKANLTLSGTRTYDGSSAVAGSVLTATGVNGETFAVTGAGDTTNLASKNVQTGSALASVTGLALGASSNGGLSGNYNALSTAGSAVSITKANLTLTTGNVSKSYDGGLTAAGTATVSGGTLFGSDSLSGGTFAFTDKNAGNGNKTVTTAGVTVADGNSGGNYNVSYADNTTSTIAPAILTATLTAPDKVYDGTAAATPTLTITGGLAGTETVNATFTASFNSKDVATANLVTVMSMSLSDGSNGGLASNYTLASGETATAHITAKALTVNGMTAANKVYDGGTAATLTGGTLNGLIGSETLGFSGQTGSFSDKNVGAGKAVTVSGITLTNGTGLASNYSITSPAGLTADISRLASVTWTGGTTGNWFDPANWANGAVPDLANVADVVIPQGVTVSFNSGNVISPAQAGAVNLDSIGGTGGMSMANGSLNVAGGLQLANLEQSGGALNVDGDIGVGDFSQTGGSIANAGNFTATNSFAQTGGTLSAGENVSITQASGTIVLGNIAAGGSLDVTATDGDITQTEGTQIAAGGTSTLTAPNGKITVAGNGNDPGPATGNEGDITKLANAIANASSTASVNSNGNNLANSLVSSAQGTFIVPSEPAGVSMESMLAGLNITVQGQGLNLTSGNQANDQADDAD